MFTWRHPDDAAGARSTIWWQPAIPLRFVSHSDGEAIDPQVLQLLADAANSARGLSVELNMLDDATRNKALRVVVRH